LKKMAPEMVVIMLTGHGSAEAAHEGIRQGAYDYLTKPCELDELIPKSWKRTRNDRALTCGIRRGRPKAFWTGILTMDKWLHGWCNFRQNRQLSGDE
jgi:DNA-binding NtrC family response regulator